jgi:hypothetical protein
VGDLATSLAGLVFLAVAGLLVDAKARGAAAAVPDQHKGEHL